MSRTSRAGVRSPAATFIASQIESSCNPPASTSCAKSLANVDLPDPAEPATRNSRRHYRGVRPAAFGHRRARRLPGHCGVRRCGRSDGRRSRRRSYVDPTPRRSSASYDRRRLPVGHVLCRSRRGFAQRAPQAGATVTTPTGGGRTFFPVMEPTAGVGRPSCVPAGATEHRVRGVRRSPKLLDWSQDYLPPFGAVASVAIVGIGVGCGLLVMARGLRRRKQRAWLATPADSAAESGYLLLGLGSWPGSRPWPCCCTARARWKVPMTSTGIVFARYSPGTARLTRSATSPPATTSPTSSLLPGRQRSRTGNGRGVSGCRRPDRGHQAWPGAIEARLQLTQQRAWIPAVLAASGLPPRRF
jgi:hypothetical protein